MSQETQELTKPESRGNGFSSRVLSKNQPCGHFNFRLLSSKTVREICICYSSCMLSHCSRVQLFEIPWTVASQAPLSKGFSRQEYWSGLLCPPLGDLPASNRKQILIQGLSDVPLRGAFLVET